MLGEDVSNGVHGGFHVWGVTLTPFSPLKIRARWKSELAVFESSESQLQTHYNLCFWVARLLHDSKGSRGVKSAGSGEEERAAIWFILFWGQEGRRGHSCM